MQKIIKIYWIEVVYIWNLYLMIKNKIQQINLNLSYSNCDIIYLI